MITNAVHTQFIVAIDGPAGSGKTTTARELAQRLGFVYVDTGAMYRAVAFAAREAGIAFTDETGICAAMPSFDIAIEAADHGQRTLLDGRDIEADIRTPEMSNAASIVSTIPCVRAAMVDLQRKVARSADAAILEGRDIGTVVFPESPCKIFLVADVRTRALRRQLQLKESGTDTDLDALIREIEERDRRDSTRELSPLAKASDAIEVETTNTTIDEQVRMIQSVVERRHARFLGERES